MLTDASLPATRLFTVDEYSQMSDLGILTSDEKTELINGEIIAMAAQNPPHVRTTQRGYNYLSDLFRDVAHIRFQAPIWLSKRSLPQPDLALVHLPEEQYDTRYPRVNDIYWLIEVADATLQYDLNTKAKLYAKAGILEYWVIDAVNRHIYLHQNPVKGVYQQKNQLLETDVWKPSTFREFSIQLSRFFA